MFLRLFTSILSSILLCMPCAAQSIDIPVIDARIKRLMNERAMVGMGVAIVENGELVHVKGYGEVLAGTGKGVTQDTVFRWASLSKSVAGIMATKLDEDGAISLSDPIDQYAKSLKLPGGAQSLATVEHVLTHQLGIVRNAYDNRLEAGVHPFAIRADLAGLPVECPVGTCHGYQNVAFDAASEMIEAVTGQSYKSALQERLFTPLGIGPVAMSVSELKGSDDWARPHNNAGNRAYSHMKESYFDVPAAGGISSSIKDLGLWMRAQMGVESEIISSSVLKTAHAPRIATTREDNRVTRYYPYLSEAEYGLGWRIYDYAGRKVVGHRGAVNGYRALILFDPELQTGIAAMWNSGSNQPVGLQMEIMDMAYGLPRTDWMYLGAGPNLNAVRRIARAQAQRAASLPKSVPTPRLSPSRLDAGEDKLKRLFAYQGSSRLKYWPAPAP